MKVISISPMQSVYSQKNQQRKIVRYQQQTINNQQSFRGGKGVVLGILSGMATGALAAAAIVATGGLAAPVAAIGLSGVMGAGAACGTHIGGLVGHCIEEGAFDDDDKKNNSDENK